MRRSIIIILVFAAVAAACSGNTSDDATTTSEALTSTTTPTTAPSTTTTMARTTTTASPSTTTTSSTEPSTTTTSTSTTTTTIPPDNDAPVVEITAPANLSAHIAAFDPNRNDFGTVIALTAKADDPDGDPVDLRWSASGSGNLGTGESIDAWISTHGSDASQPVITATATDQWGVETSASIQIIVWIPSDA